MYRSGTSRWRPRARVRTALDAEPARKPEAPTSTATDAARLDLVEPQVVDADHLAAVDVDDLAVHQVPLEADLVGR